MDSKENKPINPEEINPEYSLEGLMLKLKLQYSGHLMQDSLKKEERQEGQKRRVSEFMEARGIGGEQP